MAIQVPGSWRGVVNLFRAAPAEVQQYFDGLPELIEKFDWEIALGFMFIRVEKALNTMLYCGARKMHKAHTEVARAKVETHHMTRKEFRSLFANVFGKAIPDATVKILTEAEKIRDKVIHGKATSDADKRKAIVHVIRYAEEMNSLVHSIAGFKPFTKDLRGFTGRGESLDKSTTRWLMLGLGFASRPVGDAPAE